ncbi:MAG: 4-hydroxy-3-methylbut-2-enyl diphosphate reductase [Mangrovibacterium sp.]
MKVEIDQESGFCFGVTRAVEIVEQALSSGGKIYCLGDIVHNAEEVGRLKAIGLETIDHERYFRLHDCTVFLRAHGEPPSTYAYARGNRIRLIDATCPIVLSLQKRVKKAWQEMQQQGGQIVIFGEKGHAEVIGLNGQTGGKAIILENGENLDPVDPAKPVVLFSQTTRSPGKFSLLAEKLHTRTGGNTRVNNTICKQMSNRAPRLKLFASGHELVIFVGGQKSSNARYLFGVCRKVNPCSYFVSAPDDLDPAWLKGHQRAGVCGATSTPRWLLEAVAERIRQI